MRKIGHNLKYDYLVLAGVGLRVFPLSFDTMIAEWVVDPALAPPGPEEPGRNLPGRADDPHRGADRQGQKPDHHGPGADCRRWRPMPPPMPRCTLRLMPQLEKKLEKVTGARLFADIEMPLIPVLAEMEQNGVRLDLPFFHQLSPGTANRMAS